MRFRTAALTLATVSLGACGGGGPAAPPELAFGLPAETTVRYLTGDTATMDIDAGGQVMQAFVASSATLGTAFARSDEGIRVTVTAEELKGTINSPAGAASADKGAVQGTLVFDLDRRGVATVVSQPTVTETGAQFFQPLTLAHGLFPRLPGGAPDMGSSWTDTIRMEGPQGGGTLSSVSVVTFTLAGDTVVDGRSLVRIDMEGTSEASAKGVTTGMDFNQSVKGTAKGWYLWDMQRRLLVESYAEVDGRGTMEVAAAPFPLGLRVRSQSRVRLDGGM